LEGLEKQIQISGKGGVTRPVEREKGRYRTTQGQRKTRRNIEEKER
jgi:hypothetical protein